LLELSRKKTDWNVWGGGGTGDPEKVCYSIPSEAGSMEVCEGPGNVTSTGKGRSTVQYKKGSATRRRTKRPFRGERGICTLEILDEGRGPCQERHGAPRRGGDKLADSGELKKTIPSQFNMRGPILDRW